MKNSANDQNELLPLTGLRFVAAFYVFLFHIHIRWPLSNNAFIKNVLGQGALGMSLFFMLSGFVLAYRYVDSKGDIKEYLLNRFARIYPIYALAALLTLPWIGIDFGSRSFTDIVHGVAQMALLVFANILIIQAWFLQFFSYWNDGGSWSISVEVFCYLILPIVLPTLAKASIKTVSIITVICWFLAIIPGLSAKLFDGPTIGVFYSMPIFRLPEFLIGTCILLLFRLEFSHRLGIKLQVAVLVIFLLYLGIAGSAMPLYVGHNWITLPVFSFMIISLAQGTGPIASVLSSKLFVWLGKISYCFYSFQVLILLSLIKYHQKLIDIAPYLSHNKILAIISFIVLLTISALGYHFIEEPSRKFIRGYRKETFNNNVEPRLSLST